MQEPQISQLVFISLGKKYNLNNLEATLFANQLSVASFFLKGVNSMKHWLDKIIYLILGIVGVVLILNSTKFGIENGIKYHEGDFASYSIPEMNNYLFVSLIESYRLLGMILLLISAIGFMICTWFTLIKTDSYITDIEQQNNST